jgi:hypothetical protein
MEALSSHRSRFDSVLEVVGKSAERWLSLYYSRREKTATKIFSNLLGFEVVNLTR